MKYNKSFIKIELNNINNFPCIVIKIGLPIPKIDLDIEILIYSLNSNVGHIILMV